ncbi:MAG TPA: UbiA prenyltransferase family protein, partial [Nitrospiria bacterium]
MRDQPQTGGVMVWWSALRPLDWMKNLFIIAPLVFSSQLGEPEVVIQTFLGFALFCFLSSAVYIFNDLVDVEDDRRHPLKSRRPLASGMVSEGGAKFLATALAVTGLAGANFLAWQFGLIGLAYVLLHVGYSLILKNWVIIDVMAIAAGFVLRVLAGSVLVGVVPSAWIILCTVLLSLFLGFSKRRHELSIAGTLAPSYRKVLGQYSLGFLDQMISAVMAATVVSYALYSINNGPFQIYSVL